MDSLDTFDGSKPNLVSTRIIKDINTKLNVDHKFIDNGNRVIYGIGSFYDNYIVPNLFPLIVIALLAIYLTIRYIIKKDREEFEEKIEKVEEKKNTIKQHMINDDNNLTKISDMISDDYLLTDDEDEKEEENEEEVMKMVIDRGSPLDIDRATELVFGKT